MSDILLTFFPFFFWWRNYKMILNRIVQFIGTKPHVCVKCSKGFYHVSNLQRHFRYCDPEKQEEKAKKVSVKFTFFGTYLRCVLLAGLNMSPVMNLKVPYLWEYHLPYLLVFRFNTKGLLYSTGKIRSWCKWAEKSPPPPPPRQDSMLVRSRDVNFWRLFLCIIEHISCTIEFHTQINVIWKLGTEKYRTQETLTTIHTNIPAIPITLLDMALWNVIRLLYVYAYISLSRCMTKLLVIVLEQLRSM